MCGIAGIIGADLSSEELRSRLTAMCRMMVRRGPDDEGILVFPDCGSGLAARRLSIIDLEKGHQPACNEDETVYSLLNGEIYNHSRLRHELKTQGHSFRSRCDTEVLAHLYEESGPGFLERLQGMFGLAVFDVPQRRLTIARDGPGMKPLYYACTDHGFLFASEIRALLASGLIDPEPDLEVVATSFMTGLVPAPSSGFRGIVKLAAGSFTVVQPERIRNGRFWSYRYSHDAPEKSVHDYTLDLDQRLNSAVRSHLVADVPVGLLISGGWDSSLIAVLAARHASRKLNSYTIVFPDDPQVDEAQFARMVAEQIGSNHSEIEFRGRDILDVLAGTAGAVEEPLATTPDVVGYRLFEGVASEKVVLSGEGSDELFGGYPELQWKFPHRLRRIFPQALARFLVRHNPTNPWVRVYRILAAEDDHAAEIEWYRSKSPEERCLLSAAILRASDSEIESIRLDPGVLASCSGILERRLALAYLRRLSDGILITGEKLSMRCGLELRMPFLDRSVVDFSLSLPSNMKWHGRKEKYVVSFLARKYLPAPIARRRKFGLSLPPSGVREALFKLSGQLLLDRANSSGLFERPRLESTVRAWQASPEASWISMWRLVRLQSWWLEFFGRSAA